MRTNNKIKRAKVKYTFEEIMEVVLKKYPTAELDEGLHDYSRIEAHIGNRRIDLGLVLKEDGFWHGKINLK